MDEAVAQTVGRVGGQVEVAGPDLVPRGQPAPVRSVERLLLVDSATALARVVEATGDSPMYARIDVAPGPSGEPVVMELELIEPSLFFPQSPAALERFVGRCARFAGDECAAWAGRAGSAGPIC